LVAAGAAAKQAVVDGPRKEENKGSAVRDRTIFAHSNDVHYSDRSIRLPSYVVGDVVVAT
jgi:hypothetical protein